jgi:hypothetical protein
MNQQTDTADLSGNETPLPGQPETDEDDLVTEVVNNLSRGRRHWSKWRIDAIEEYDFFAGIQWAEEDITKLNNEGRPAVTFNRTARTINAVTGLEVQNRQEVRYFPRRTDSITPGQMNDSGFSEMQTNAAKWVREQCDAEDEESEAFHDCAICGIGWTDTRMDYEDDPEGKIIIERIDPLEMVVDPESKKCNFSDARWVAHIKNYTRKEIQELWGDVIESNSGTFWNDSEGAPHDADNDFKYESDQGDRLSKTNTISVARYQYYKRVNMYKVQDITGELIDLDEEKFKKVEPFITDKNMRYVKYPKRIYKELILIGRKIIEQTDKGCNHFTFRAITGLRDRNRNYWFGLMRLMKDPQRWGNKWMSQIQHIINTNAKGGAFVERGALSNPRKAEEDWSKPDAFIVLNDGALSQNKIMPREMPRYPEGIDRLLQYALSAINDVTGVSLELIGLAERDQAYVLEQTRKQAGITILATFFDSLRRYRKVQGRILAYFIREYISDGRLIRVLGPEGAKYIPLMRDELSFEYDIIVDDAPTSPNVKEKTFNVLNQIVPMCLQSGIAVPPDILDYAPLPEDLISKWKQSILSSMNDPLKKQLDQIKLMQATLDTQEKQANIENISSEMTLNYAKAEEAKAKGSDQAALAMQRMGMSQADTQLQYQEMMKEQARKDLEMMLNQRRKEIEAQMNMKIKERQANQKSAETNQ